MHPAGHVAGGAELRWALLGFSGHCWTRGSHPRAQKCRFCVKTTQNLGKIAHFDTKNPILCSKGGKTGEKLPFLTQKPRFCARKARKRGFRRSKAHKNADFVLGKRGKWHREATASGSADAKGYREAAAGKEAFPSREGTRQHREETPSRGEAKMAMGSAQQESA